MATRVPEPDAAGVCKLGRATVTAQRPPLLSVVVPVYDEEDAAPLCGARLIAVLSNLPCSYEVIFVDDGSRDKTSARLGELAASFPAIKVLQLTRNFGHQAALLAGLEAARGDAVVTMDGDLQHPPELIPALLAQWRKGAKVVATQRRLSEAAAPLKRLTSKLYYRVFSRLSGLEIAPGMADFRLLDRSVVNELLALNERSLFLRGLVQWLGHAQVVVPYDAPPRARGISKFTWAKMLHLAWNGITSFSTTPLRLATVLGFLFSGLSFIYLAYAMYTHFFTPHALDGWTSVIGSVLFLGGVQLICLGIIGEYVGRIFHEVKKRPSYVVEHRIGLADETRVVTAVGDSPIRRRSAAGQG